MLFLRKVFISLDAIWKLFLPKAENSPNIPRSLHPPFIFFLFYQNFQFSYFFTHFTASGRAKPASFLSVSSILLGPASSGKVPMRFHPCSAFSRSTLTSFVPSREEIEKNFYPRARVGDQPDCSASLVCRCWTPCCRICLGSPW